MTGLCPTADRLDFWTSYREGIRILRARQAAASTPARHLINDQTSNQFPNAEEATQADASRSSPVDVALMGGADDSLPPILFTTDSVGRIASRPGSCASHEAASASSPYGLRSFAREVR